MIEITMPQLGESVVEASLESWLVKPGDRIEKYQPLCEVISDKVNVDVPAPNAGKIVELLVEPGTTIAVGAPICLLDCEDDVSAPKYSPAVIKIAQENNVDLSKITGSGADGRITRKDVHEYIAESQQSKQLSPKESVWRDPDDELLALDPIRRTIGEKMVASVTTIPHAWAMMEVDVSKLVKLRNQEKDEFYQKEGIKLTYLPFFIKAVVSALKNYPIMNSSYTDKGIVIHKHYNISIAVATEKTLFVPVIHDADQCTVSELAHRIAELAAKAKRGKLIPADISKGTFTVNNTGTFGSQSSKPIINPPQSGMITLEAINKRPIVTDDEQIAIRSMTNICLSFDHRVTDGLTAGRFLHAVCNNLKTLNTETM